MKALALCFGIGFGFVLGWARLTEYDVIRDMLLLREFDLYLMMGSAVVTAFVGSRVLRASGARSWVDHAPIGWATSRPTRQHVSGSIIFGLGWGIAGTCPGPVAAQLGRGQAAALPTVAGILAGVALMDYLRRREEISTAPIDVPEATATSPGL
jgi:hypothetical protein